MLIKKDILNQIETGKISLVFRRWKRPTVKSGGTLRTAIGVLSIDDVSSISSDDITETEAHQAGFANRAELLDELNQRDGTVYRIKLRYQGQDPRELLREKSDLTDNELAAIKKKLHQLDQRRSSGAWTEAVLQEIRKNPGLKAADLARLLGLEKEWLKRNVRKLKELGLTESLSPGYRISPRGKTVLGFLDRKAS